MDRASMRGHLDVVKHLLEHKADVNKPLDDGSENYLHHKQSNVQICINMHTRATTRSLPEMHNCSRQHAHNAVELHMEREATRERERERERGEQMHT